jgi:serine/threonine protein kinase
MQHSLAHACKCKNASTQEKFACKVLPKERISPMTVASLSPILPGRPQCRSRPRPYCDGETFHSIIEDGRLDRPNAANVFLEIVSAIAYCHSFRSAMKRENVLVDEFRHVKVAEFGLGPSAEFWFP